MSGANGHGPSAPPRPARDVAFERGLLRQGQEWAGLGSLGWDDQVIARLERMQHRHGDRWQSMPVADLLREIREEGLDAGGWPVLLAQHPAVAGLDDGTRMRVLLRVQAIASLGARLEFEVRELEQLLE